LEYFSDYRCLLLPKANTAIPTARISNSMNNTSEILRDYILLLLLIVNILILIMRSQTMYSAASPIIKCVNDFDMN
jgi:hypothetical protein